MHDGCSGSFSSGLQVLQKIRMMGFATQPMPMPMPMTCQECGEDFQMVTFEFKCPSCGMVYAVTPCHAFDPSNVQPVGKDV